MYNIIFYVFLQFERLISHFFFFCAAFSDAVNFVKGQIENYIKWLVDVLALKLGSIIVIIKSKWRMYEMKWNGMDRNGKEKQDLTKIDKSNGETAKGWDQEEPKKWKPKAQPWNVVILPSSILHTFTHRCAGTFLEYHANICICICVCLSLFLCECVREYACVCVWILVFHMCAWYVMTNKYNENGSKEETEITKFDNITVMFFFFLVFVKFDIGLTIMCCSTKSLLNHEVCIIRIVWLMIRWHTKYKQIR